MSCDIHLYVEKLINSKWISLDKWKTAHELYGIEADPEDKRKDVSYEDAWYSEANYRLFSILANVRNSYIKVKHEGKIVDVKWLKTIAQPKGIPDNLSPELKTLVGEGESSIDHHHYSWFTLKELIDFDFDQPHANFGYVYLDQYCEYKQKGYPEIWDWYAYSMYRNKDFKPNIVSNEEMEQHPFYEKYMNIPIGDYYNCKKFLELLSQYHEWEMDNRKPGYGTMQTEITWTMKYRDHCPKFVDSTMQRMLENCLESDGKYYPGNIRIVFWFDN